MVRPVVAGGTGASTPGAARTALGVVIGTDVQAFDAGLASIAGLTTAADKMIYTTALDTYAGATLTAEGRTLLAAATKAAQRAALELVKGTADTQIPVLGAGGKLAASMVGSKSAAYAITPAGLSTFAHGLGVVPRHVTVWLKCLTAENGYAIGDEVEGLVNSSTSTANRVNTIRRDATNVYLRLTNNTECFSMGNKTTGVVSTATTANWEMYIEASL